MAQTKEQNQTTETNPKEKEAYELHDKEFKVVIKMFYKHKKIMNEQN